MYVDLDPVFLSLECIVLNLLARDYLCMRFVSEVSLETSIYRI